MEHPKFAYGPGIVQLLQARGLPLQERLPQVLTRIAEFVSRGNDKRTIPSHVVGLVAALPGGADGTDAGELWCKAVEAMFRHGEAESRTALVVESDPVERKYAAIALGRSGMTVNAVDHADAAFLCDALPYDFILMDYAWPTGHGAGLASEIRAGRGPNQNTYILGCSGNRAQRECLTAGMDDFLQKPIDLATLKMRALRAASGALTVSSVP